MEYAPEDAASSGPRESPRAYTIGCEFWLWDTEEFLWDLSWEGWLKDSNGTIVHSGSNGVNDKPAIYGSLFKAIDNPDSSYTCEIDWHVNGAYLGEDQTTVYVQHPTYLAVTMALTDNCGDPPTCQPQGCSGSCQAYYWKIRDYQVHDQIYLPIPKVMLVDETFSTQTNTCNVNFVAATATTDSAGKFRDNFFMHGVPVCSQGGSCSVVRNQTWTERASQRNVANYQLTYTCNSFSIQ